MNDGKILQYKKLFIEPEHHDYFMQAMRSLSSKEIMEVFRSFFWKEPIESVVLLGGQPRKILDIRGHHVLEAMELRKHNPKLLENYADFWINLNRGTLEKIEAGDFPDEVSTTILNLAHFLVHTPADINTDILTDQLAAQSEQIAILEQRVQTEQERYQHLEHDLEQTKRKLQELETAPEQLKAEFSKQQLDTTTIDEKILDYKNRLLEPGNHAYLILALRSLSDKVVTNIFKSFFRKEPAKGVVLLNAQLRKIADARGHHVLESIDRIRKQNPKLLENYADFWINLNKGTLEKTRVGEKVEDDVNNTILNVALFLAQPSNSTNAQVLTERLADQSQKIIALEQQIQTEQQQNEKREQVLNQTRRKLEQAQDTTEKRLLQMQTQLEHKHQENLKQALKVEEKKRLEELKKLNTEMTHLHEKLAQEQRELEFLKHQLDEVTDALEAQHTQTQAKLELLQRAKERMSADLFERTRALTDSEQSRMQLRERNQELLQALENIKLEPNLNQMQPKPRQAKVEDEKRDSQEQIPTPPMLLKQSDNQERIAIFSLVERRTLTQGLCTQILIGSRSRVIEQARLDRDPSFGILNHRSSEELERVIGAMLDDGSLENVQGLLRVSKVQSKVDLPIKSEELIQDTVEQRDDRRIRVVGSLRLSEPQDKHHENIGDTKLENALIIDYRHLSSEPAERLVMLLQIYKAFLEQRKDFQLVLDHTNYADFVEPDKEIRGVLLLGLEQLLLDSVNLPLIQWLNTQAFRQESVLKQLLGVLESPRLRGLT